MENPLPDNSSDYRLVAILNKRIETGKVMNALAHCVAGVTTLAGDEGRAALKFIDFVDFDGRSYPSVSARSFVILRGSEGDLRKVYQRAGESTLPSVAFVESMTGGTYVEQLEKTKVSPTEKLTFYAVALLGTANAVNPITKKYSLWRADVQMTNAPAAPEIKQSEFVPEERT